MINNKVKDINQMNKISLSCFDDKRSLHDNGIDSYVYGHNLLYFLVSLNSKVSQAWSFVRKDDDTDPFALSSNDYKAPQAKRTKKCAWCPYNYLELKEIILVEKKQLGKILKSKLP